MVSININLVFTMINLVIFYLLMKKFLIGPIHGVMEKRAALIQSQLEEAKRTEAAANQMKVEYEESLQGAKTECTQMIASAKESAKKEYDRIVEDANQKSVKIMEDSRKTIQQERDQAMEDMQAQIAQLALAAVGKVLPGEISQEENDRYYARFLREAGEVYEAGSN